MKDLTGTPLEIANFLEQKWFEKSGLFASILIGATGSILLFTSEGDGLWTRLIVAAIATAIILSVWLYSRKTPKTKAGRVGILIAITCESDEESQRLRADFIAPLQRAVHNGVSGGSLHLIELPRFLAVKVIDGESALAITNKSRARLVRRIQK